MSTIVAAAATTTEAAAPLFAAAAGLASVLGSLQLGYYNKVEFVKAENMKLK